MLLNCYNYKKRRINEAIRLLEKAIYEDDYGYMFDTIKYTNGLHINYIFKTTLLKTNYKMSLINFAARCNSYNCVISLLKNNADINIYDSKGWLPIHYAGIYHEPYKNQTLLALLSSPYININCLTLGGKIIIFNNVKMKTKGKSVYQLANHYLCYGSCKIIQNYIKNKQKQKNPVRISETLPMASMAKLCYKPIPINKLY